MTAPTAPLRRIVVAVDGSEGARLALRWALDEARLHGATVEAVHVWSYPASGGVAGLPVIPTVDLQEGAEHLLAEQVAGIGPEAEGVTVEQRVVEGSPARRLTELAADADLLVVGARGLGGFAGLLLGSVSTQVAQHATRPVAIVRPGADGATATGPVAVGIDGSDHSLVALRWAAGEARARAVPLHVVLAWSFLDQPGGGAFEPTFDQAAAEAVLDGVLTEEAAALEGVDVHRHVVTDLAARALLEAAEAAGLVVVGSRGLGGFARLRLGSVSHQVAQHATCPVVIVPGGGDASEA